MIRVLQLLQVFKKSHIFQERALDLKMFVSMN